MLQLSDKFVTALVKQPEAGMGYQTADVLLKDGKLFKRVTIVGSQVVAAVHGYKDIPFAEPDISMIMVTNEKWNP